MSAPAKDGVQYFELELDSGKKVVIRPPQIRDRHTALEAVGPRAGTNQLLAASLVQEEVIKMMVIAVDKKPVDKTKLERPDDLFTYPEFQQLTNWCSENFFSEEKAKKPKVSMVNANSFGAK